MIGGWVTEEPCAAIFVRFTVIFTPVERVAILTIGAAAWIINITHANAGIIFAALCCVAASVISASKGA